jgi:uncharacterized 2Fe-2S/4Fe-4S cluster protein (DUF4445 family)
VSEVCGVMACGHPDSMLVISEAGPCCEGCRIDSGNDASPVALVDQAEQLRIDVDVLRKRIDAIDETLRQMRIGAGSGEGQIAPAGDVVTDVTGDNPLLWDV